MYITPFFTRMLDSGVPRNFVRVGSTNQLREKVRENGVPLNLQMSETGILIRLLRMYFPRNWEFGLALSKLRNFRELITPNPPSVRH
jgi:hypothetical protein